MSDHWPLSRHLMDWIVVGSVDSQVNNSVSPGKYGSLDLVVLSGLILMPACFLIFWHLAAPIT